MTGESVIPQSQTELAITGMTCGHCAQTVSDALRAVAGVENAATEVENGRSRVWWKAGATVDVAALKKAVRAAGYDPQVVTGEAAISPAQKRRPAGRWRAPMVAGLIGTIPLMLGEWVFGWTDRLWFHWISFVLAALVQTVAGASFYRGAWQQLRAGKSNMDTLVALGSTTAFAYSLWALFAGVSGHLYFLEAAAIITVVSLGHWVEARVSAHASDALRELMHLAPDHALRRHADGREVSVPIEDLHLGDEIVLKPGDRVPVDGVVIDGESSIDESMLTGESLPQDKLKDGKVWAGTANLNGRLILRTTATGAATALANIMAAVRRAQESRANIQRLGDQVSSVFVPIVVLVAAATAAWWWFRPEAARQLAEGWSHYFWVAHVPAARLPGAVVAAAAVLIVACPCAMGLATPAALMVAANAAARRGILIRDGVALEKAGRVTTVLFDKTGTLTAGRPAVAHFETLTATDGRGLAASLARRSNHPLSQAIARVSAIEVPLGNWEELRGFGLQAACPLDGNRLARLGSPAWLQSAGVDVSKAASFEREWTSQGATVVGLAVERELVSVLALRDSIKPDAGTVVATLIARGLKVCLVSGDNRLAAESIARTVGIPAENVFAEVRPEKKADLVRLLQGKGERIAFVGDGINDAPALEQADLGVAVSRASDIAREAADLILMNSELRAIPEGLELARKTLRIIKQNLFWAFFYNCLGIPLAAMGLMSPVVCAAAMGFSDLIVIGNALRLRRFAGG